MTDDDPKPNPEEQQPEDDLYLPEKFHESLFGYLSTKRGNEALKNAGRVIETELMPAIKKLVEGKAKTPAYDFWKWLTWMVLRFLTVGGAVGALIYLKKTGNLDAATATALIAITSLLLAEGRRQDK